jgi:hypothetical protein
MILEISEDGRERSNADTTTDNDAVRIVVETLCWGAERSIDADADVPVFWQVFERSRPVAFELDVYVQYVSFAV